MDLATGIFLSILAIVIVMGLVYWYALRTYSNIIETGIKTINTN